MFWTKKTKRTAPAVAKTTGEAVSFPGVMTHCAYGIPGLRVRRSALKATLGEGAAGADDLWVFDAAVVAGRVRGHATPAFGAGAPERLAERLAEDAVPYGLVVAGGSAATGEGALSRGYADAVGAATEMLGLTDPLTACVGPTLGTPVAGPVMAAFPALTDVGEAEEFVPGGGCPEARPESGSVAPPFHAAFPFMDAGGEVRVAGWFWPDPAVMVWVSDLPLGRSAAESLLADLWTTGPEAWALTGDAHPGDALMLLSAAPGLEVTAADERMTTLRQALLVGTEMLLRKAAQASSSAGVPTLTIEGAASAAECAAAARVWVRTLTRLHRLPRSTWGERLFRAMAATPLVGVERSRMSLPPFIREGRIVEEALATEDMPLECVLTLGRGAARTVYPLRDTVMP